MAIDYNANIPFVTNKRVNFSKNLECFAFFRQPNLTLLLNLIRKTTINWLPECFIRLTTSLPLFLFSHLEKKKSQALLCLA